jgi:transposase
MRSMPFARGRVSVLFPVTEALGSLPSRGAQKKTACGCCGWIQSGWYDWSCPVLVDTSFFAEEVSTMPKSRPPYPAEFRRKMIDLVGGRTPEELEKLFEPTAQTICNGVAQAQRDEGTRKDGLTSVERVELNRLRREVRRVTLERDILAKATAWFARQTGSIPDKGSNS